MSPTVVNTVGAMRQFVAERRRAGATVGLAPTMGALHEGHLSLVDRARSECDTVVVSVFVNPTQFGPGEDYARYPRDLANDARLLGERGADVVFAPDVDAMYPPGDETRIDVGSVANVWEGEQRPGHFAGVATVVAKLLAAVPADRAYFGRKDYQQTVVVRRLVRDLLLPVEIVVCPIVRDTDGLALSSRNAYLSVEERQQGIAVPRSLESVERLIAEGEADVATLRAAGLAAFADTPSVEPEYLAFLTDGEVRPVETISGPTVVAVAARVGSIRLIDNLRVTPPAR
ncbi:MAG: pantoate--beta-alanine ligase [Planctomycetota bacterium]